LRNSHSSLLNICGDGKANLAKAVAYFGANVVNNARPFLPWRAGLDWPVVNLQWSKREFERCWADMAQGLSPTRAVCNLFWMALPWCAIRQVLGGEIHILDVGCGNGGYFGRLQSWTKGKVDSYHGIDVVAMPAWNDLISAASNVSFQAIESPFSASDIPTRTNLIITQSSVEHFEFDTLFFCETKRFADLVRRPLLQVHLVPSAAGLWLYLLHGYRQYTPYTIGEMTRCFADNDAHKVLFPLGGRHCNRLHFFAVTLSMLMRGYRADQRRARPEWYHDRLRRAVLGDSQSPGQSPSFYALILASRVDVSVTGLLERRVSW
jgi:hypothetical protein